MSENVDNLKKEIERLENIVKSKATEITGLLHEIYLLGERLKFVEKMCFNLAEALLNYSKGSDE
jgi:hypothetical protein